MSDKVFKTEMRTGKEFADLRKNPDRGFRLETYLTLGSNTVMFKPGKTPLGFLDEERVHYADLPVGLVQFYVYLTEYCKKPLDEKAFAQLKDYLCALRERNLRAVLRFAYEFEVDRKTGPTSRRIYGHLSQIAKWFSENEELASQTILVVQAGIIGAWGEWHTARYWHNQKKVLQKICNAVPDFLPIQVRTQKIRERLQDSAVLSRVGYHDDFLVGNYHKWNAANAGPGTADFARFVRDSASLLNDGEMPWGRDKTHQNGYIDGYEMLTACAEHSLSSLSIVHNFTEEGGNFNAVRWQTEPLTAEKAKALGCPFLPEYFEGTSRTVFEYLTDHLGYQIAVRKLESKGDKVFCTLENGGFALPYGFTQLNLHLEDSAGNIVSIPFDDYTPQALPGGKTAVFTATLPAPAERIGVSLRKPVKGLPAVRFANLCDFQNGIHWFE